MNYELLKETFVGLFKSWADKKKWSSEIETNRCIFKFESDSQLYTEEISVSSKTSPS